MRVLPSFNHSPTSTTHSQTLPSQRCRPRYKDKLVTRSPGPLVTPPTRKPESPTHLVSHKPDPALRPNSDFSPDMFHHITMEAKAEHHPCGMEDWEAEEDEEEEGLGYMMMSPQVSHSSSVLPRDDYVVMASPQKHNWPDSSDLQASINR